MDRVTLARQIIARVHLSRYAEDPEPFCFDDVVKLLRDAEPNPSPPTVFDAVVAAAAGKLSEHDFEKRITALEHWRASRRGAS